MYLGSCILDLLKARLPSFHAVVTISDDVDRSTSMVGLRVCTFQKRTFLYIPKRLTLCGRVTNSYGVLVEKQKITNSITLQKLT